MTPHVVVFAELSPRARVQYTRFLLDNRVQFCKRESDGRYIANVRLALPEYATATSPARAAPPGPADSADGPEEEQRGHNSPAVPTRFQRLANLVVLTGERKAQAIGESARPYAKETRLVRLLNEIYDARSEENTLPAAGSAPSDSFARFVRHYLTNRFGLRKIVDQQTWELVEGLTSLQHRLDVELFVSFIEGKYPNAALAFCLSARSHVQRMLSAASYRPTLHKSTGSAAQLAKKAASLLSNAAPLWLSRSQLEALGPLVFGAKTDDLHIEFAHAVRAYIASDPDASATRAAARALTVNEFLLLSAETWHKSAGVRPQRSPGERHRAAATTDHGDAGADDGSMTPKSADTPVSSTGAVAFAFAEALPAMRAQDSDEQIDGVQVRLGSLLERAKLRQQHRQNAAE